MAIEYNKETNKWGYVKPIEGLCKSCVQGCPKGHYLVKCKEYKTHFDCFREADARHLVSLKKCLGEGDQDY